MLGLPLVFLETDCGTFKRQGLARGIKWPGVGLVASNFLGRAQLPDLPCTPTNGGPPPQSEPKQKFPLKPLSSGILSQHCEKLPGGSQSESSLS